MKKYQEAHEGKTKQLKLEIEQLDALDDTFGLEEIKIDRRNSLMDELLTELQYKESQLFQRSRAKWIAAYSID
ncbi:hypothetical protein ACS0TY_013425 [Phlomoides rotata]